MLSIIEVFSVCTAEIAFVDAKRHLVPGRADSWHEWERTGGQGHPQLQLSRSPAVILARGGGGGEETQQTRSTAALPRPGGFSPAPAPAWVALSARCSPEAAAGTPRAQVIVVFAFQPLLYTCITEYGGGLF